MTKPNLDEPLSEGTWMRISLALLEAQRELLAEVDAAHDRLRQKLQVIALDEATPGDEEDAS